MKLVDNWKKAHTWISVHCLVLEGAIYSVWQVIPPDMKDSLPHWLMTAMTISIAVIGVTGRLLDQGKST